MTVALIPHIAFQTSLFSQYYYYSNVISYYSWGVASYRHCGVERRVLVVYLLLDTYERARHSKRLSPRIARCTGWYDFKNKSRIIKKKNGFSKSTRIFSTVSGNHTESPDRSRVTNICHYFSGVHFLISFLRYRITVIHVEKNLS